MDGPVRLSAWRRENLRTTLWLVPAVLVLLAGALFALTYSLDRAVYRGDLTLPSWVTVGGADAGRQVLSAIAAAVITVVGVVFSITILSLTLASQQFGPRMLRNFIRDFGTQFTLGTFVATFVYAVLALGSITSERRGDFVPHISIGVALALLLGDLIVLIYFIHHIARSIQLPEVIAGIARDLGHAIDAQFPVKAVQPSGVSTSSPVEPEVAGHRTITDGAIVPARTSGYLQFVGHDHLVAIAKSTDTVIELLHRPGHFVTAGLPLSRVWPGDAAPAVFAALDRAHVTGPHRTLAQDPTFAIDQLVEIAIRALSPAVNDTFTALTCIDWLADGLCKVSTRHFSEGVFRDDSGVVRLIEPDPSYSRMVNRSYDKIRQSGRGMPAVMIRQMDSLTKVLEYTTDPEQRDVLVRQADMILRASEQSIAEPEDLDDVRSRYEAVLATLALVSTGARHPGAPEVGLRQ